MECENRSVLPFRSFSEAVLASSEVFRQKYILYFLDKINPLKDNTLLFCKV